MIGDYDVIHSEFNPYATDEIRFLQVWLLSEAENTKPLASRQ